MASTCSTSPPSYNPAFVSAQPKEGAEILTGNYDQFEDVTSELADEALARAERTDVSALALA
jgi:hypothetical protein